MALSPKYRGLITGLLTAGAMAIGYQNSYAQNPDRSTCPKPVSGLYASPFESYIPADSVKKYCEAPEQQSAQQRPAAGEAHGRTQRSNPIYSITLNSGGHATDLTAAGDGVFGRPYVIPAEISPENGLSFHVNSARGQRHHFSVMDGKRYLENRIRMMGPDSALSPREKAVKYELMRIKRGLRHDDLESIHAFRSAIADGSITIADSSYAKGIKDGVYAVIAETRERLRNGRERTTASVPILIDLKNGYLAAQPEQPGVAAVPQPAQPSKPESTYAAQPRTQPPVVTQRPVHPAQPEHVSSHEFVPPGQGRESPAFQIGLEGLVISENSNIGGRVGLIASLKASPWLRLEVAGGYLLGQKYSSYATDTTDFASQMIGASIYKNRTDVTATGIMNQANFEAGIGLTLTPSRYIELPLRVDGRIKDVTSTVDETSTITFTRNGQLIQPPSTISNTSSSKKSRMSFSFTPGVRVNLGNNFSLEGFYSTGEKAWEAGWVIKY